MESVRNCTNGKNKVSCFPMLEKGTCPALLEGEANQQEYMKQFRSALNEVKGLRFPDDDPYLVRFLRAKKYNVQNAVEMICNYYKMKTKIPDLADISLNDVKHVYTDLGIWTVLKHRGPDGSKMLLVKTENWDPAVLNYKYLIKAGFYLMFQMNISDETQMKGIRLIIDNSGLTFKQTRQILAQFSVSEIRRCVIPFFQGTFPAFFKGFHMIKNPYVFDLLFAVVKYFLKEKIRARVHMHSDFEDLHKMIDVSILPRALGGNLENEDAEDSQLLQLLFKQDEYFKELNQYGFCTETDFQSKRQRS